MIGDAAGGADRPPARSRPGLALGGPGRPWTIAALLSLFVIALAIYGRLRLVPDLTLTGDLRARHARCRLRPSLGRRWQSAISADRRASSTRRWCCSRRWSRSPPWPGLGSAATREATPFASAIAARAALRRPIYPHPCWQDPLTEAYGRELAGAVRALAPAPNRAARPRRRRLPPVPAAPARSRARSRGPAPDASRTAAPPPYTSIRRSPPAGGPVLIDYWVYRPTLGWERITGRADSARSHAYASTPLPDSAGPQLIPLETLLGRDDARFPAGERPPWQGGGRESLGYVSRCRRRAGARDDPGRLAARRRGMNEQASGQNPAQGWYTDPHDASKCAGGTEPADGTDASARGRGRPTRRRGSAAAVRRNGARRRDSADGAGPVLFARTRRHHQQPGTEGHRVGRQRREERRRGVVRRPQQPGPVRGAGDRHRALHLRHGRRRFQALQRSGAERRHAERAASIGSSLHRAPEARRAQADGRHPWIQRRSPTSRH